MTTPTLPPNTAMVTTASGEQKPRKLRASCDACSRAKVKCDKVRPTCHRCGNMGICCNYSPSMRLGKPRKNRNPDGTIMREVSPLNPRPDMIPRTTNLYAGESSPEPTDPFFFGPATPEYHYQDAFMGNGFDGSQSPYSEAGSFVSGWSNDEQLMFQSPSEMFTSMPQFSPPAPAYHGHIRTTSVQSQPEMFAPMDGLHSPPTHSPPYYGMSEQAALPIFSPDKIMASPPPMIPAPLPTPPAITPSHNHDHCTKFAFETLNSLYSPPASQPAAGDFNGATNGLPTLDTVLSTTKAAVEKLFVLLACPCSSNPHFSTTIAFTITKILSWYQAVAGAHHSLGESPVNTPLESFVHTPISLGEFRLETDDEDTFRTQLVLGELRKVEKLIDKFQERYCKAANPAENGIDGGVYSALESLLRTRVRDTFKVTMKSAPEEVKRQIASKTRMRTNTV